MNNKNSEKNFIGELKELLEKYDIESNEIFKSKELINQNEDTKNIETMNNDVISQDCSLVNQLDENFIEEKLKILLQEIDVEINKIKDPINKSKCADKYIEYWLKEMKIKYKITPQNKHLKKLADYTTNIYRPIVKGILEKIASCVDVDIHYEGDYNVDRLKKVLAEIEELGCTYYIFGQDNISVCEALNSELLKQLKQYQIKTIKAVRPLIQHTLTRFDKYESTMKQYEHHIMFQDVPYDIDMQRHAYRQSKNKVYKKI